jgi:hypothetical protein
LPAWYRGPAHLEDGDIVLDVERAEPYEPSEQPPGLLYDLAAIREPADALGFARRWGLLWLGQEDRDGRSWHDDVLLDDETCRESFADWAAVALRLSWALSRNALIRLGRDDGDESHQELARYWVRSYAGLGWSESGRDGDVQPGQEIQRIEAEKNWWRSWDRDAMLFDLRDELAEDIASYLAESGAVLHFRATQELEDETDDVPPTDFVINAHVPHLEGLAYYELMLEVSSGSPMKVCPEDARIFPVRDARQRYCSPQCSGRARYRRFAQRKREAS